MNWTYLLYGLSYGFVFWGVILLGNWSTSLVPRLNFSGEIGEFIFSEEYLKCMEKDSYVLNEQLDLSPQELDVFLSHLYLKFYSEKQKNFQAVFNEFINEITARPSEVLLFKLQSFLNGSKNTCGAKVWFTGEPDEIEEAKNIMFYVGREQEVTPEDLRFLLRFFYSLYYRCSDLDDCYTLVFDRFLDKGWVTQLELLVDRLFFKVSEWKNNEDEDKLPPDVERNS